MNKKFNSPPSACIDCWRLSHKECPEGYTEPRKSRIVCKNHIKDNNQTTIQCQDCIRDYCGNCPETSDTQCEVIRGNIECKSYYKRNTKQTNEQQKDVQIKECMNCYYSQIEPTCLKPKTKQACEKWELAVFKDTTKGVKYDGDKPLVALVMGGFMNALNDCVNNNTTDDRPLIQNVLKYYNTKNIQHLICATNACIWQLQEDINNTRYQDAYKFYGQNYDAIMSICAVGTFGAKKYAENNWMGLEDGEKRTLNAAMRHIMAYMSGEINNHEEFEKDGVKYTCDLPHLAHAAWELLACIEFSRYRLGLESTVKEAQDKLKGGK